ncbi:MAG: ATP-binding protein [Oscillospiraceae bacterium]|nr:ATP-binding protein [Oscillospiraceae bacterium]
MMADLFGKKNKEHLELMLDSFPMCAQVWRRDLTTIDCNEAAVKLYGFKDKEEYTRRFIAECSPEVQPCGVPSAVKAVGYVNHAFEDGYCCFDWTHRIPDKDECFPAEVTLVRTKYKNEDVVLGYTRDLRELKRTKDEAAMTMKTVFNSVNSMVYVTVPETGEILFINEHMREHYNLPDKVVGEFCYKVLQDNLDEMCVFCPCFKLAEKPDSVITWTETSTFTGRSYRNTDRLIDWVDGRKVHIQHSVDVTDMIAIQDSLEKRDAMLLVVNQTALKLLSTKEDEDIKGALHECMELVGYALSVDRIYIWQCCSEGEGAADDENTKTQDYRYTTVYGWDSEFGETKPKVPMGMSFVPRKDAGLDWDDIVLSNECVNGSLLTMSANERAFITRFGIKSVAIVPMFLDNQLWGVLTVGDCFNDRTFTEEELTIMRSISLIMANAINRHALIEARTREIAMQSVVMETLFDSIPNMIYTKDTEHNFTRCNRAMLEHLGKKRDDILGKTDTEALGLSFEVARKNYERDCNVFATGKAITYEARIPKPDGTAPYFEVQKLPLVLGSETIGVIGLARDINERKEREKQDELHRTYAKKLDDALSKITKSPNISNGDLKAAANVITLSACETIATTRVTVWMLGSDMTTLCCESSYNRVMGEYSALNDIPLNEFPDYVALLNTERIILMNNPDECKMIIAEGTQSKLCAALDAPMRVDGRLCGVIGVEQYRNEKYSNSREWTLEEQNFVSSLADMMAIAISAAERNAARDEAKLASQAKSDFLANISHEIRTPMNVIVGLTEILLDDETPVENPNDYLQKINTAGTILVGLINDILDISKIEARMFTLAPTQYELASLLNDIIVVNMVRIGEKPIKFELEIEENLPAKLFGDDLRVKQILTNILSNAFKYTRWGTVTFSVKCTSNDRREVCLSFAVKDTGIGMRPEDVKKLFSDYSQVDTQANRMIEGTGLGLSIAKGLVELMGGSIRVESEYGEGSTFFVKIWQSYCNSDIIDTQTVAELKSFKYSAARSESSKITSRPDLSHARVLVVDDSPTNLDVAKGLLKKYKMQVDTVLCGQDALDRVRKEAIHYNIIFMDHMMPGMDGIEAFKLIRKHDSDYARTVPVVALTANAVAGNEQMFLNLGFAGFVAKPIKVERLHDVVLKFCSSPVASEETPPAESLPPPTAATPPVKRGAESPAGINLILGLSLYEDDMEMLVEIMHSFATNIPNEITRMRELTPETLSDYAIDVHTIKGAAASIGAKQISVRAKNLERMAKDGDYDGVAELNTAFCDDTASLIEELRAWLDGN